MPPSSPLLSLRRAAWPFRRALTRPPAFVSVLATYEALKKELTQLQELVVDGLYRAVPEAPNGTVRREWLALKRAVFNGRKAPRPSTLPDGLEEKVERYREISQALAETFPSAADEVVGEIQDALQEVTGEPDFRRALAYSSPDLLEALENRSSRNNPSSEDRELTRLDRGVYAYLARFTTKANPLHLFAGWLAPGLQPARGEGNCEVIFDSEALLALERRLVSRQEAADRQWLQMRPVRRLGDGWEIWLPSGGSWKLAQVPVSPFLEALASRFAARREEGFPAVLRRKDLAAELAELGAGADGGQALEAAQGAISTLLDQGLLQAFLIRDLFTPAPELEGIDPASDPLVEVIGRYHLERIEVEELDGFVEALSAATEGAEAEDPGRPERPRTYVNRLPADDLGEAQRAAEALTEPLERLKPLFAFEHNFSPNQRVIRTFYAEQLAEKGSAPFLELLATFLRHRTEILERLGWGREAPEYGELRNRCCNLRGELSECELGELVEWVEPREGPTARRIRETQGSLCYAGPYDFESGRFFLGNVFAGRGRFASRYHLSRRRALVPENSDDAAVVDVELVPPPVPSLNFVVQRYLTGCGFEARWGEGYDRWIEPQDLEVRWQEGEISYRDTATGDLLRFHPRSFLLAQYLPVEYQLLLVGHGDSFRNPFGEISPRGLEGDLAIPGLTFGPVCLRRPTWYLEGASISKELEGAGPSVTELLAATARLRHGLQERCGTAADLWFYSLPLGGKRAAKPRLLDLLDPLSVLAFHRALSQAPGPVALTVSEPGPQGLWQHEGEGYASELMVEV